MDDACPVCAADDGPIAACPRCLRAPRLVWVERASRWMKIGGGATIAMTLMACYGQAPVDDDHRRPDKTADPTKGAAAKKGETLGGLELGLPSHKVTERIGEPEKITEAGWLYEARGLAITFEGEKVTSVEIKAPSKLATSKGITIGSPRSEAEAAHGTGAGELYFKYEADKVSAISLGPFKSGN